MKTVIKSVLVASALVAGAANAAIVAPSNGASDLILFVTANNGTANDNFYVFDTGVSLDTAFAKTNVASGDTVDTTKFTFDGSSINTGPNLASFISSHSTETLTWALMASDPVFTNGTGNVPYGLGNFRFLFSSSSYAPTTASGITNTNLKTATTGTQSTKAFFGAINAATYTNDASTSVGFGDATGTSGLNAPIAFALNKSVGATVGTAQSLFVAAVGTATSSAASAIYLNSRTFTLNSNGTLSVSGGSTVPVPGALWLLGSGLLGLVGISRRRSV